MYHWTKVPWTTVSLDYHPLDNCCNTVHFDIKNWKDSVFWKLISIVLFWILNLIWPNLISLKQTVYVNPDFLITKLNWFFWQSIIKIRYSNFRPNLIVFLSNISLNNFSMPKPFDARKSWPHSYLLDLKDVSILLTNFIWPACPQNSFGAKIFLDQNLLIPNFFCMYHKCFWIQIFWSKIILNVDCFDNLFLP